MAAKAESGMYKCETCGMVTSEKGHLCKPKLTKLNYVCGACGRVAVDQGDLCKPSEIKK